MGDDLTLWAPSPDAAGSTARGPVPASRGVSRRTHAQYPRGVTSHIQIEERPHRRTDEGASRTVKEFSVDESMQVRPDWAMVGVRDGEWCYIYASSQLLSGELSTEMDYGYGRASLFVAPTYTITMSVNMRTYVIVRGHTYGECMVRLMETWNPDEPQRELSGTRALGESR